MRSLIIHVTAPTGDTHTQTHTLAHMVPSTSACVSVVTDERNSGVVL